MRKQSPANLQRQCDAWNRQNPVGTPVTVLVNVMEGDLRTTTTRSEAYVLSGHSAVIMLDGISGCYLLSHVTPEVR